LAFDFAGFARFNYRQLFRSRGTPYRMTPKRMGWFLLSYSVYTLVELVTWAGFLADEIFFRPYRQVEIREPVFILGNPRSGTTFLHRLLAKDEQTFTCTHMWEALAAPSVAQRRVVQALGAVDRVLGRPLDRLVKRWRKQWQEENVMHRIDLRAPEEDQYLLVHAWSTLAVWLFTAVLEEARPYIYFDSEMPSADKARIMGFYQSCVRRHLFCRGGGRPQAKHYLSKNPSASPKVDALYESFPDAKIIYLARSPLEVIPSYISLLDYAWRVVGDPVQPYGARDFVLEMARHWYTYPLEQLERAPEESHVVVRFDDLVRDAERTVTDIYDRFGFEMTPAFAQVLRDEAEVARSHASRHEYCLEEMGLTREQIVTDFGDIFDRFGFDTRQAGSRPRREWARAPASQVTGARRRLATS
jgi:hypothetical protein